MKAIDVDKTYITELAQPVFHYKENFVLFGHDHGKIVLIDSVIDWRYDLIASERGIYYLFKDGEIVYIGVSKDIRKRIKDHVRNETNFDGICPVYLSDLSMTDIKIAERYLIKKLNPKYNRQYNPKGIGLFCRNKKRWHEDKPLTKTSTKTNATVKNGTLAN